VNRPRDAGRAIGRRAGPARAAAGRANAARRSAHDRATRRSAAGTSWRTGGRAARRLPRASAAGSTCHSTKLRRSGPQRRTAKPFAGCARGGVGASLAGRRSTAVSCSAGLPAGACAVHACSAVESAFSCGRAQTRTAAQRLAGALTESTEATAGRGSRAGTRAASTSADAATRLSAARAARSGGCHSQHAGRIERSQRLVAGVFAGMAAASATCRRRATETVFVRPASAGSGSPYASRLSSEITS
jgi:hypothetical protein